MNLKKNNINKNLLNQIRKILISNYGEKAIKKKKVLWVEWWTEGREIEQMKHVIAFLRDILGWDIDLVSSFNPLPIFFRKYDLAILSGIVGSKRGINWSKFIFENSSIPIFISHTEGIYRESEIEEFVWGHQKENKKILWTTCSHWSKKSYDLSKKYYPFLSETLYISGSLVIDDYVIEEQLIDKKVKNKYDFGIILNDELNCFESLKRNFGIDYANNWLYQFHLKANKKLIEFINKFHGFGYTFVIKPHPGLKNQEHFVVRDTKKLNNVSILSDNFPIKECLKSARVFITQNSTAAIQALCLNKAVFRVGDYPPCFDEYLEIPKLEIIEKSSNSVEKFKFLENYDFSKINNIIISNTIGFTDGFNHFRFVNSILKSNQIYKARKLKFNLTMFRYIFIFYLLFLAYTLHLPISNKFKDRYKKFNIKNINRTLDMTTNNLIKFYKSKHYDFKKIIK